MKVALVKAGVVANVAESGVDAWTPPVDVTAVELPDGSLVGRGWLYDGVNFTQADIEEPQRTSIPTFRVKLELLDRGKLTDVDTAINALAEPKRSRTLVRWNNAAPVELGDAISDAIKNVLGLTNNQLDKLFTAMAKKE